MTKNRVCLAVGYGFDSTGKAEKDVYKIDMDASIGTFGANISGVYCADLLRARKHIAKTLQYFKDYLGADISAYGDLGDLTKIEKATMVDEFLIKRFHNKPMSAKITFITADEITDLRNSIQDILLNY